MFILLVSEENEYCLSELVFYLCIFSTDRFTSVYRNMQVYMVDKIKNKDMDTKGNEGRKSKLKPRAIRLGLKVMSRSVHFLKKGHIFDYEPVYCHCKKKKAQIVH